EWTTATPPPHDNFAGVLPTVYHGPYEFAVPGAPKDYVMQTDVGADVPGGNGFHGGGSDGKKRKFSPWSYRITMWMVLAAIVMMFGALSVAYVMASEEQRTPVPMPRMFFLSTGLILVSSATFHQAKKSLQEDRGRAHLRWL